MKLKYVYFNRFTHSAYDIYNRLKRVLNVNSIPLNNGDNYKPFFIVGSGRSGNTLLRSIINTHENLIIPPETYVLGKILHLHKAHNSYKWENYVNLMLATIEYHKEFYTFEIDSLQDLAHRLKKIKKEQRSLAYLVNQFYEYYAEDRGRKINRWGDKTPFNSVFVYHLKQLFPQSQYIHMVRDGIDVVNSYLSSELYQDPVVAALRWKRSVNFLRKFGDKNSRHYLEIRYEDLVRYPDEIVNKVCAFLDIPFDEKMLNQERTSDNLGDTKYLDHHQNIYNKINTESIGKGRRNLSKEIKDILKPVINKDLKKFEYEELNG